MPRVFLKTKIPKFNNPTTYKSIEAAAKNAEIIAKNSILKNQRNGTKWSSLPYTSSLPGNPPAGQSSKMSGGSRGLVSGINSTTRRLANSTEIVLKVDGRKRGLNGRSVSDYAFTQEFGLKSKNVEARPYLTPAIKRALRTYKMKPEEIIDAVGTKRNFRF